MMTRHCQKQPNHPTILHALSRAAECLLNPLVRLGWVGVYCEGRLVLVGLGQNRQKLLERGKVVSLDGSLDDRFDAMVARDVGRVSSAHRSRACCTMLWLLAQPLPPACGPAVVGGRIDEQVADGAVPSGILRRIA